MTVSHDSHVNLSPGSVYTNITIVTVSHDSHVNLSPGSVYTNITIVTVSHDGHVIQLVITCVVLYAFYNYCLLNDTVDFNPRREDNLSIKDKMADPNVSVILFRGSTAYYGLKSLFASALEVQRVVKLSAT